MPDIRFLFRYRDLVGATLQEHRAVIAERHACWWGWWKRPTEDNRHDVWDVLQAQAEAGDDPLEVGLFHSGLGTVHFAKVSAVIPPVVGPAAPHPAVPPDERLLIPAYYRESPFSFAWMKLVEIAAEPTNFFGMYSFLRIPTLPNYSADALHRLERKVIVEPEELRGMDTTIWEVRPKHDNDETEKIFFTLPSLPRPVSYSAVVAPADTILHITDPHYACAPNRAQHRWALEGEAGTTMAEAVLRAINNRKVGLIIVTGDLTFRGSAAEFAEAGKGLQRVLGPLDLGVDNVVIIPGNHDIVWTQGAEYNESAEVLEAPPAATANYREFYRAFFRHDANTFLSMGRRYVFPSGISVDIAGLNSSSLEQGANFLAGMGRIQEAAFQDVAQKLKWDDTPRSLALRVLAIHHHLTLTENLEAAADYSRGFGVAIDAVRVQRLAANYGVQLALHGHKHRAFAWRSSVYELPEDAQLQYRRGDLAIIGGGSSGSSHTPNNNNFFNLIDVKSQGIRLEMFRAPNGGIFQAINNWSAKFSIADGRLMLSDWDPDHVLR